MTIAMTMKIKFDPSIVLAFLTCCAQPAHRFLPAPDELNTA
jgi:hypothetical protein